MIDSIRAINREFERKFPDCTYSIIAADSGNDPEWVAIDLDVTRESMTSLDWYRNRAEAEGLALAGFERGQGSDLELEPELVSAFIAAR